MILFDKLDKYKCLCSLLDLFLICCHCFRIKIFYFYIHFDFWEAFKGCVDFVTFEIIDLDDIFMNELNDFWMLFRSLRFIKIFDDSRKTIEFFIHLFPDWKGDEWDITSNTLIDTLLKKNGTLCDIEKFFLFCNFNHSHDDSTGRI